MTTTRLRTYTGEAIKVAGILEVEVALGKQREQLELLVVDYDGPSLFGKDWLTKLKLDWCQLNQVRATDGLQRVLNSHKNVFDDELGKVKDVQAKYTSLRKQCLCFAELGQCPTLSERR